MSFEEISKICLKYLQGKTTQCPCQFLYVLKDSSLLPLVIKMIKLGFLPLCVRNGVTNTEEGIKERAHFCGFTYKKIALSLKKEIEISSFIGSVNKTDSIPNDPESNIPVEIMDEKAIDYLDLSYNGWMYKPQLDLSVNNLYVVNILDPNYGRRNYLFTEFMKMLEKVNRNILES